MEKVRSYAFDFDGVIAKYDGFKGRDHFGEPNEVVVATIRQLSEMGHKIILHSTRGEESMRKYCLDNNIPVDYLYVDDRAVCYRGQTTEELVKEITEFKAHWEK